MSETLDDYEYPGLANRRLPRDETLKVSVTAYEKRRWTLEANAYGVDVEDYLHTLIGTGRRNFQIPREEDLEGDF
jgi:hypothetical protein